MKSQDWMDKNNLRSLKVDMLIAFCSDNDLEYTFTEKKFTVKLPYQEDLPITRPGPKRKTFDVKNWGPKGVVEGELVDDNIFPDELPPTTTPLDEGKPPEGDDEK